jgi:aerobic-type carbon monoxide dehydrogenase small subunit (CoxS/CutS family)
VAATGDRALMAADAQPVGVALEVNGEPVRVEVPPDEPLADTLRGRLGLTATKIGCGVGACGICTVLVDGEPMSGCLLPTVLAAGRAVVTVEGLADRAPALTAALHEAFEAEGGYQCGICTPGQLTAAVALLERNPRPSEQEVRAHLAGNLCRCTGYAGIVRAVRAAAAETDGASRPVAVAVGEEAASS